MRIENCKIISIVKSNEVTLPKFKLVQKQSGSMYGDDMEVEVVRL